MADGVAGPGGGWTPVPDPTVLTAGAVAAAKEDLRREVAALREILEARLARTEAAQRDYAAQVRADTAAAIAGLEALLSQRIGALEGIVGGLDVLRDRITADAAASIGALRVLYEERFAGVGRQFTERDTRYEHEQAAAREALDRALSAQKDLTAQQNESNTAAAAKAEAAFIKQADQLQVLIAAMEKAFDIRINELKERIDRGEGQGQGRTAALGTPYEASIYRQGDDEIRQAARHALTAQVISAVAVLVSVISLVILILRK